MTLKKKVILLSILGLVPFYWDSLSNFFQINYFFQEKFFSIEFKLLYAALIISFLCGMQWQVLIYKNKKNFLEFPLFIVIVIFFSFLIFSDHILLILVLITSLICCLVIDIIVLKGFHPKWFVKLRVFVTFFALISFAFNFFY